MEPEQHKLIEKLASARDRHKSRWLPIRILSVAAGATVLLVGLVMLVAPGPAFAVIPLGLFILALEFVWAERALAAALRQADKAKQTARETSRAERLLLISACLLAFAGLAAWAFLGDIPLLPV